MPTKNELEEIAERILECIVDGASSFVKAQDKSIVREFRDPNIKAYDEFFSSEQKFDLGRVTDPRVRKAMNFVLGLDSQTVFLQLSTKKTNGYNSEANLSTIAVPAFDNIICFDRWRNDRGLYGRSYEDSICCSRFDASHMQQDNTNGATGKNHVNTFDRVRLADEERMLYERYFETEAPCPHFHYYRKDVCWSRFSNDYSFAINEYVEKELSTIIQYVSSRGLNIVSLSDLLNEKEK